MTRRLIQAMASGDRRDVAIDNAGRIYIADTGNKRIRVYALSNAEAVFQYDIGSGGSGPGELDEPSGLAIHADGRYSSPIPGTGASLCST